MKRYLGWLLLVGFMISFCCCYVMSVSCAINVFEQVKDVQTLTPEPVIFEDVEDRPAPAEMKKANVEKEEP